MPHDCDGLLPLDRADRVDVAGRKAATLARLRVAGFPVPDGFVVPAAAAVDDSLRDAVQKAAAEMGGGPFAVRSSGVDEDGEHASHAGQYATVLGVEGGAPLLEAIAECQASGRSEQVRAYRAAHGLPPEAPLAVLVQRMVTAAAAGVAFTADPVTGDRARTVVSAVRGLGDRLVDGAATPDEWVVCDGAAHCRSAGEEAIDAGSARAVAELARRVEAHEGAPQDIEWALADGELFLLQARPVTGLSAVDPVPVEIDPPPGYWTREASHAPQPWSPFTRTLLTVRNQAFRHMVAEFGFLLDGIVAQDIGGWEYMRLVPLGGKDRRRPPDRLMPLLVRAVPAMRARIRDCVAAMRADTAGQLIRRWHDHLLDEFAARIARLRDSDLAALPDDELDRHFEDARALYDDGCMLHMRLHGAIGLLLGELMFACQDLLGWDETRSLTLLSGLSTRSTEPARGIGELAALARARPSVRRILEHVGAGTGTATGGLPPGTDPEFARAFAGYRRFHGCRALRYEAADPTVDEVPGLILDLVRDQLASGYDPHAETATLAACRAETAAEARRLLAAHPTAERERFERALARAELAYPVREDNAYYTTSAPTALVRLAALEVGGRLADRGQIGHRDDVFQLEPDEVRAALRSGAAQEDLVARRKGERAWVLAHPGPASYGTDPGPPPSMAALPAEARQAMQTLFWLVDSILAPGRSGETDGAQLRGLAASSGSYTGPVRIIRSEAEFGRIRAGDVLVCPTTSPVWSMLFPSIGALVTDTGGVLSHPAIIAREYQVPAVVAAGQATTLLREGETVTVDGTAGTVAYVR